MLYHDVTRNGSMKYGIELCYIVAVLFHLSGNSLTCLSRFRIDFHEVKSLKIIK